MEMGKYAPGKISAAVFDTIMEEIPVVGSAVKFLDRLDEYEQEEALSAKLEAVRSEVESVLQQMNESTIKNDDLESALHSYHSMQRHYQAMMFGGLVRYSKYYETICSHPKQFGEVLTNDSQATYDPEYIHMYVPEGKEGPFMLKMSSMSFFMLLQSGTSPSSVEHYGANAVVGVSKDLIDLNTLSDQSLIVIGSRGARTHEQTAGLLQRLKEQQVDIHLVDELVTPGQPVLREYDRIVQHVQQQGARPLLLLDDDIEQESSWELAQRMIDNRVGALPMRMPGINREDVPSRLSGIMTAHFESGLDDAADQILRAVKHSNRREEPPEPKL